MLNINDLSLDSKEMLNALCDITKKPKEEMIKYIETEPWCNYYEYVKDYNELVSELFNDEALENEEFFSKLEKLDTENNYKKIVDFLADCGWRISSSGFAIQFDDKFVEKYNI